MGHGSTAHPDKKGQPPILDYLARMFPAATFFFFQAGFFYSPLYPIIMEIIDPHEAPLDGKENISYYIFAHPKVWYLIPIIYFVSLVFIVAYIQVTTTSVHSTNHPKPGQNLDGLYICKTCNVIKEWDTVHCNACERCIHGYDHHCHVLHTCISDTNFKYFIQMIGYTGVLFILMGIAKWDERVVTVVAGETDPESGLRVEKVE